MRKRDGNLPISRSADEADVLAIAPPQPQNTIAKLAHGIADDALTCVALALNPKAKVLVAPAMNGKILLHPATQENVAAMKKRSAEFIGPEEGLLSCGYEGLGRLWPVDKVAARIFGIIKGQMMAFLSPRGRAEQCGGRFAGYDLALLEEAHDIRCFRGWPAPLNRVIWISSFFSCGFRLQTPKGCSNASA